MTHSHFSWDWSSEYNMNILQSIILGIVQGLTEFLPVSSSGHLVFCERLLHISKGDVVFEVMVHVGTLAAVLYYFRKRIIEIIRSLFMIGKKYKTAEEIDSLKLAWYLILGTIPAVVFGFFFKSYLENSFGSIYWTSIEFLITGAILIGTIWARDRGRQINNWNTLFMGVAQAIAIIPAISRSGSTIAAGMFSGIKKEKVAEFSFLLSIPAIGGAAILEIPGFLKLIPEKSIIFTYLIGTIISAIVGYFSIALLISIIKRGKFFYFGVYCILLGIAGLLFL
jgi:undecaprenyl-diphosphatase